MPLSVGDKLGHYEVISLLGQGGMGEVYKARDTTLKRDVALKVLPASFLRDSERMARFQREAEVLASLDHPNVGPIYGIVDSEDSRGLVLALIEGPTLADQIALGPLPLDDALSIAKQIIEALEYAHDRGVVHRDLKPANIKITPEGVVKVLDFGLAKVLEDEPPKSSLANSPTLTLGHTRTGVILGTAAYMSPEQAVGRPVDRRSDIFSFGAVLYEMLAGNRAFAGATAPDVLEAVVKNDPDWSALPASTPGYLRKLLKRTLAKDRKQRLQAIGEARIVLAQPHGEEPTQAVPVPAPSGPMSMWQKITAIASVVGAVLAIVYFRERQRSEPEPEPVRFQIAMPTATRFSVSPDGRKIVFAASGSDHVTRLWIRPLGSLEATPIVGSETQPDVPPPFWSPDSQFLAYQSQGKLKKISVSGGPAQTVCELTGIALGGTWSREGVIIYGTTSGTISRVPAAGGTPSPVTGLDVSRQDVGHSFPVFLPDGRHFVYFLASRKVENVGLYAGSLDSKPAEQSSKLITATFFAPVYVPSSRPGSGHLLFRRESTLMAQSFDERELKLSGEAQAIAEQLDSYNSNGFFSASPNGVLVYATKGPVLESRLSWLDPKGRLLGSAGEPGYYLDVSVSPSGTQAAMGRIGSGIVDLWLLDLVRSSNTRFTFHQSRNQAPVWSPDESRIIFQSNREGVNNLYQKRSNGATNEEVLLKSAMPTTPTSWSRDGRYLLYTSVSQARNDIWTLRIEDRKPTLFLGTEFEEDSAQFSPDGRWVVYVSNESGRNEVYVRPFSPDGSAEGGKWIVSKGGGANPKWLGNGKELRYVSSDRHMMGVDVNALNAVFQPGPPRDLFALPQGVTLWDVTSDGRILAAVPVEQPRPPTFTVVLNWQTQLKK